MQIFVKTCAKDSLCLNVEAGTSVEALKALIEDQHFIPAAVQRLNFGTKQLTTGVLEEMGMADGDSLTMLLDVLGGMRAKWRKKRMRRLRRKRRKMRQRAR